MKKNKILFLIGVLFIVGYLVFNSFQNRKEDAEGEKNKSAASGNEIQKDFGISIDKDTISEKKEKAIDKANSNADIKEIEIMAKQWEFQPSVIELKKGDKVKLKIRSVDVPHGFAMPVGYKIDKRLNPGEIVEIEFTADKVGEFPYFCSIGCGEGHFDMAGKIIVSE